MDNCQIFIPPLPTRDQRLKTLPPSSQAALAVLDEVDEAAEYGCVGGVVLL